MNTDLPAKKIDNTYPLQANKFEVFEQNFADNKNLISR